MAHQTIEFPFSGMDQDSDPRLMQPGDGRYRLNCINDSTDAGLLGDIQNLKGNVAYTHVAPAGTNICIGSTKDIENNAIIYFVYNSNGDHQIRRFFPDLGTDQLIIQSDVLNFQSTSKIYHVDIVGELLYWTDGWFSDYGYGANNQLNYNPPRKINIAKAIAGDPGYAPLTFETLDRIKYPPAYPPTLKYAYDSGLPYNYIYGKMFQVASRFTFDDKEISTWSSLSKVLLPAYAYKDTDALSIVENTIVITFDTGSEIVTDIELSIRSSITNVDGGASYFIIAKLNKAELGIPDNSTFSYTYEGIALKENLEADDYLRPFDYVPQISKAQFYAGGRLVDWNEVENYDNVDIDVTSTLERYDKYNYIRETSPSSASGYTLYGEPWGSNLDAQYPIPTFKSDGAYQYGIVYYDRAGRAGIVNTKEEYIFLTPQYDENPLPLNGMWMDPLKLRLMIDNPPPIWAKYYQIVLTKELTYIKKTMFAISAFNYDSKDRAIMIPPTIGYTFEEGDRVRFIAVNSVDISLVNADYPIFDTSANLSANEGMLPWSDLNGDNENYLWGATTSPADYQIEEVDQSGRIVLSILSNQDILNQGIRGYRELAWASGNWFYVLEIYNKNRNETDNKIFFEVGDKFEIGDAYLPTRYHKGPVQDQVVGVDPAIVDIYGFDAYLREKKQKSDLQNYFGDNTWGPGRGLVTTGALETTWYINANLLPIYSNLNLTSCIPFDIGGGPNPVAGLVETLLGPTFGTDGIGNYQAFITNPEMTGLIGNFWGFTINGFVEFKAWVEDESFADDYPSTVYNDGRPNSNLETLGRKDYFARGRWSEQLFENTLINGLSTVLGGSYKDLSERYGAVSRIRQVGDTLRVRQKSKMTSFYLNKNMLNVNEGVASVGQSSDFLSTPNLYDEEYGSSSPGADIDNGIRTNYLIDLLRGIVIRDAGNKPGIISGDSSNAKDPFKMTKYFRDLFQQIREAGEERFNIIAAWDDFSQLYTLTIQNLGEVDLPQSQTIVFHEPTNRWKSFMSYVPEWYETLGKYLVSFKNGQPYVHYENPLYNNFYGVQYGQELRVTANMGRNTVKIFNNLDLYSNIAWEVPTVSIPSSINYPNGMLSKIPAARFVAKEGVLHAPFFRDQNDPKYSNSVTLALTQGRRLRGETIELTMTNTSTSLVYVKALNIFVEQSELTI